MGQVLYRKYRPTKLEDVVGQKQVTDILAQSIKNNKLSHAYLFIGPRGTGKTSVARIFAHAVNDFNYQIEDSYLDIIEIDAASNTGVDNIRDLREKAIIAPTKGKYKVYIIDEVHMLTKSASNALLKTLEEPPEHVIFIMATTDAHKVPITISSRTQVHTFKLADAETMKLHLKKIAQKEKIPINDAALELVVTRGGGSFRDSLSLLDQVANLSTGKITADILASALGLPQDESIKSLVESYNERNSTKIHKLLEDLLNSGIKPEIIASELITNIVTNPRPETLSLLAKLPEVQSPFPEAKLLLALLEFETAPTRITPSADSSMDNRTSPAERKANFINKEPAPEAIAKNKAPEKLQKPQPKETSSANFSWEEFIEVIHEQSDAIYSQLQKVDHEFDGKTLHIFPSQKFAKNILERPGNNKILTAALPNIQLIIHNIEETTASEDATISQVSAIMGGVQEVKGDLPF